jgi:hypothetical protein
MGVFCSGICGVYPVGGMALAESLLPRKGEGGKKFVARVGGPRDRGREDRTPKAEHRIQNAEGEAEERVERERRK